MCKMTHKQECKVFIGGLSWETTGEKLRAYFENFGAVREAFVSYNRNNGRPRGFGFVVFESSEVADKVVAARHMIDRREVEAKKAVPKDDSGDELPPSNPVQTTKKIFVGGLAPSVDEASLKQHFVQYGEVEDAVVMYDHENRRPRGFGFVSFASEDSVDQVFSRGAVQTIADKPIEIKAAVPRDQMPPAPRVHSNYYPPQQQQHNRPAYGHSPRGGYPPSYGGPPPGPNFSAFHNPSFYGPNPAPPGRNVNMQGNYRPRNPGQGVPPRQLNNALNPGFGPNYPSQQQQQMPNSLPSQQQQQRYTSGNSPANSTKGHMQMRSAYDVYNDHLSSLYNIAGLGIPNGLPGAGGVNPVKISSLNNQLKALNLTGFGFPNSQQEAFQDESAAYSGQEDFANEAVQGLNNLGAVNPDYTSFHESAGFSAAPAPGWSS